MSQTAASRPCWVLVHHLDKHARQTGVNIAGVLGPAGNSIPTREHTTSSNNPHMQSGQLGQKVSKSFGTTSRVLIPPRTTCVWVRIQLSSQGAQLTSNTAGVHECVNQQHGQDTSVRHLAILQYTTSRSLGSLLWRTPPVCGRIFNYLGVQWTTYGAHHLYVGAYSTTVQVRLMNDVHKDSTTWVPSQQPTVLLSNSLTPSKVNLYGLWDFLSDIPVIRIYSFSSSGFV